MLLFQTQNPLDSSAQISAFVKLKLAHCARAVRPALDYNRGYLLIHCIFNEAVPAMRCGVRPPGNGGHG
jgi:hypothetical protein